jgi:hypothetical protein
MVKAPRRSSSGVFIAPALLALLLAAFFVMRSGLTLQADTSSAPVPSQPGKKTRFCITNNTTHGNARTKDECQDGCIFDPASNMCKPIDDLAPPRDSGASKVYYDFDKQGFMQMVCNGSDCKSEPLGAAGQSTSAGFPVYMQPIIGQLGWDAGGVGPDIAPDWTGGYYQAHRTNTQITSVDYYDPGKTLSFTIDLTYGKNGLINEGVYTYKSPKSPYSKEEHIFDESGLLRNITLFDKNGNQLPPSSDRFQPIIGDLNWGCSGICPSDETSDGYKAHRTDKRITSVDYYDSGNGALSFTIALSYGTNGMINEAVYDYKAVGWQFSKAVYTFDENGNTLNVTNYDHYGKPIPAPPDRTQPIIGNLNWGDSGRLSPDETSYGYKAHRTDDGRITSVDYYDQGNGALSFTIDLTYGDDGRIYKAVYNYKEAGWDYSKMVQTFDAKGTLLNETNYDKKGKPIPDLSRQPIIGDIFGNQPSADSADYGLYRYVPHRTADYTISSMDVFDQNGRSSMSYDFSYGKDGMMSAATEYYKGSGWQFEKTAYTFDENGKTLTTTNYKNGKPWIDTVSGQPVIGFLPWRSDVATTPINSFVAHRDNNDFITSMDTYDQNGSLMQTWDFTYGKTGKMSTSVENFKGSGWQFEKTETTYDETGKTLTTTNYKNGKPWIDHVTGQPIIYIFWNSDSVYSGNNWYVAHRTNDFISSMDVYDHNSTPIETWDFAYGKSGKMSDAIETYIGPGWEFSKTEYTFDESGKTLTTTNYDTSGKPVSP